MRLVQFISQAFRFSMVFLYGSTGEIITEKTGHLNLGTPGVMCIGAAGGCLGAYIYVSNTENVVWILAVLIPFLFAAVFAGLMGLLYSFLTVSLRANQNVTGLMITTFGVGLANFIKSKLGVSVDNAITSLMGSFRARLPFAESMGWFGQLFFSYGIMVYVAIVIAIATALILNKTRAGLHLRAVGESPATADAAGINVTAYKYVATIIGSAISGLGGLFYTLDFNGAWDSGLNSTQALGWLAVALVIFVVWKPNFAIFGSFIFGALYLLPNYINSSFAMRDIIQMLPYVVTIAVLIVTSIADSKNTQPPASLGLNYFREER
ncbi:MAG: ABC transporter permease [Clostridia bacterium]|nr:ABC transporter permease [Clostridia bacterium]